jgi:hypothetical protein
MPIFSMTRPLKQPLILACTAALSVAILTQGCAPVADQMLTRVEANVARDQMMLVRATPPTFGYQRLITNMRDYPDLATFVDQRGLPDFLAETGDRTRRYLILYYLRDREAFACRTISPRSSAVEFAGPYPITDREFKTLDGIRRNSSPNQPAGNPGQR